jgi:ribonuclease J
LTRIANGDHPEVVLEAGDAVIYSSRIIPGNEKEIFAIHNLLAERGVHVLTERDHFVHVSGHPCRDELTRMYQWVRPQIAVPVHGEMRHLLEHAQLARDIQVPQAFVVTNGKMLRLAPGKAEVVDEAPAGRLYRDGNLLVRAGEGPVQARRGLSYAGFVGVTLVLDRRGYFVSDPVLHCEGIPEKVIPALQAAAEDSASRMSQRQLADDAETAETVRRAVRKEASVIWGKRPITRVEVVRVK